IARQAAPPARGPQPPAGKAPAKTIPIMQSAPSGAKPPSGPAPGMTKAGPQPPRGAAPAHDAGPVKTGVATGVGIKVTSESKEGKGSGSKENVRKGKVSKTKFGCVRDAQIAAVASHDMFALSQPLVVQHGQDHGHVHDCHGHSGSGLVHSVRE